MCLKIQYVTGLQFVLNCLGVCSWSGLSLKWRWGLIDNLSVIISKYDWNPILIDLLVWERLLAAQPYPLCRVHATTLGSTSHLATCGSPRSLKICVGGTIQALLLIVSYLSPWTLLKLNGNQPANLSVTECSLIRAGFKYWHMKCHQADDSSWNEAPVTNWDFNSQLHNFCHSFM